MKHILKKLFLGNIHSLPPPKMNPLEKRVHNIQAIWNNNHQDDNGIEKIIRLFLSSSQLLFPGIYIKYLAGKKSYVYEDLALDFYIVAKVIFPLIILINGWAKNEILIWIMLYLVLETILYIPTLIFASDSFSRPRSYKRSIILIFFNYIEIVFSFAVFYSHGNYLNQPFHHWFDAVYFSVITSSTVGYGDFFPITTFGKFLVSVQALLFLFFLVLFLNFFSTKVKSKGYFDEQNED